MAAAARWGEPETALKKIKDQLAALRSEVRYPSVLEPKIAMVRQTHMDALAAAVAEYAGTPERPVGRAARLKIENVEIAFDAFCAFVLERDSHTSSEHATGRAEVAMFLRDALDAAIGHFNRL